MYSAHIRRGSSKGPYALMAWTIPLWQWLPVVCEQYAHTGLVSLTVMVKVVGASTLSEVVGVKPEKKPPFSRS